MGNRRVTQVPPGLSTVGTPDGGVTTGGTGITAAVISVFYLRTVLGALKREEMTRVWVGGLLTKFLSDMCVNKHDSVVVGE